MANPNDISKTQAMKENKSSGSTEERGKKAIEADKKFNKQDKSESQKDKEEKKDAEQWRNEG